MKNKKSSRKKRKGIKPFSPSLEYKKWLYPRTQISSNEARELVQSIRLNSRNLNVANHVLLELLEVKKFKTAFDELILGNDLDVDNIGLSTRKDSDIDEHLNFMGIILYFYSAELNDFLAKKKNIVTNLLRSNYEEIEKRISDLSECCGESIWSLSTLMTLYCLTNEDEKILKLRNSIPEDLPKTSSSTIIYECLKSRSTATYESYNQSLNRQLEDLKAHGLLDMVDYVKFISNFDPNENYKNLKEIITKCSLKRLPDLYTYFVRIIKYCKIKSIPTPYTNKTLKSLAYALDDNELKVLHDTVTKENIFIVNNEELLKEATDHYIKEDFTKSAQVISKTLSHSPELSYLYEIISKCPKNLDKKFGLPPLIARFRDIYRELNEKRNIDANIKALKVLYLNLKQFDWAYQLKAQIEKFTFSNKNKISTCYNFSDMTQVRFSAFDLKSIQNIEPKHANLLINKYFYNYDAIQQYLRVVLGQEEPERCKDVPNWRMLKGIAEYSYYSKNFDLSLKSYEKLLKDDNSPICGQELHARIVESYLKNKEHYLSIKYLSRYLLNKDEPSLFPLRLVANHIVKEVTQNENVDLLESCVIVLHFYNTNYPEENVTQEISNIIENILGTIGITKLEQLTPENWPLSHFVLSEIMSVDVLDGLVVFFDDDIDVYKTKLTICSKYLNAIDKYDQLVDLEKVKNDYSSTFNRLVLYICSSDIKEGRIKVEKEALKSLIIDEYGDNFEAIDRNVTTDDIKFIDIVHEFGNATVSGTNTVNYLADLLLTIFREYTVNKLHGLDHCLNIQFRHGEIRNTLWSPLRRNMLSGVKKSEKKFDVDDVFSDYNLFNESSLKKAKINLQEFLIKFEEVVINFRESCNADSVDFLGDTDRFFNYELTDNDFKEFIELFASGHSLSAIIDSAFNLLDVKTNRLLQNIKSEKIPALSEEIDQCFDSLIDNIAATPLDFQRRVNLAKSLAKEKIHEIRDWFDWAEEPSTPFNFGAVFEKSIQLIESLYPSINFDKSFDDDTMTLVKPSMFTSFVTMLTLALENAARHSGLQRDLEISVKIYEESGLNILISNSMSEQAEIKAIEKISVLKDDIEANAVAKASRVSGSGVYKIKTLLTNRLNLNASLDLIAKDLTFYLKVKILNKERIAYEDINS
ncbi:hypothetical protein [Idiomarina abyssalis]|uniref:hypothetical protein n=1 Tax=Idiomarina abyssalis TaxID=86102 RepID=UPI003A9379F1